MNRKILLYIYNEFELKFTSNGIAVIDEAYNIIIKQKMNDEYNLTFKLPKKNNAYRYLKEGRFIKCQNRVFIIRQIEEYLFGNLMEVSVYCEHIMFELLDEFLPVLSKMQSTPSNVLSEVLDGTRFNFESYLWDDVNISLSKTSKLKAIEELCKLTGGIRVCSDMPDSGGRFTLTLLDSDGQKLGILVHNRKNRKSIKRVIDGSMVITRLYPFGAEDLTIQEASGSGGKMYIDSPRIYEYERPREQCKVFDGVYDADTLLIVARDYLEKYQNPKVSYEVEMSVLKEMLELDKPINIGDRITVIDEELGTGGVTVEAQVSEITYYVDDLNQPLVVSLDTEIQTVDKVIADMMDKETTAEEIPDKGNVWTDFITLPFQSSELEVVFGVEYATKPVISVQVIGSVAVTPVVQYITDKTNEGETKYTGCTIRCSGSGDFICVTVIGRV